MRLLEVTTFMMLITCAVLSSTNPEKSKKIEEDRKQAVKERFFAYLTQSLSEWYPNREEFQQYLMKVSISMELHEFPRPEATLLQQNVFEGYMTRILDYPNYKPTVRKAIKNRIVNMLSKQPDLVGRAEKIVARLDPEVELFFLDDEALGNQTKPAVQAAIEEIFDEFMRTLENNLETWYPTNSRYYLDLVSTADLARKLFTTDADSKTNKDAFERNVIDILNSEPWNAVRVEALKQRIEKTLMKQYPGFRNYHEIVIYYMENDVRNKLEANLIFDVAMLEKRVQFAVKTTDQEVRSYFLNKLRFSIKSWYPNSNELFNSRLIGIADTENFYLKNDADTIQSNNNAFEDYIKPILKHPEFAADIETEIKKRVGSMFSEQKSIMQEYEDKVFDNFLHVVNPQSQADLLFNNNDFKENFNTALGDAEKEIENAYAQLKDYLNTWLPNSQQFVDKFVPFVRNSRPSMAAMKNFDKSDFVLSGQNIESFAVNEKDLIDRTIQNEVKGALKQIDGNRVDKNLEKLKIEKSIFLNRLTTAKDLENEFRPIFSKIKACVDSFDSLVDDLDVIDPNTKQELKTLLKSNLCVRDELCVKTNGNIQTGESLQMYIEAFYKAKHDSQAEHTNDDQIDDAIYDVIEKLLSNKQKVEEEAARCFVKYLKREGKMYSIYSPSLKSNEVELAQKIEPFQKEYETEYKRFVKNH